MTFNRRWVWMWAFNVVVLLALLVVGVLPAVWLSVAVLLFFIPEAIGLWRSGDSFPPLTQVVRRYLPRWLVHAAIGAGAAWAIISWWPRPHHVLITVIIVAVAFWMADHFDLTYDNPPGS